MSWPWWWYNNKCHYDNASCEIIFWHYDAVACIWVQCCRWRNVSLRIRGQRSVQNYVLTDKAVRPYLIFRWVAKELHHSCANPSIYFTVRKRRHAFMFPPYKMIYCITWHWLLYIVSGLSSSFPTRYLSNRNHNNLIIWQSPQLK